MTLGTILKNVLGPSSSSSSSSLTSSISRIYHHPTGNKYFPDEKSGREFYSFGHYQSKPRGKSKSEKKHAVLSALSLLAFLFFLNILQNCIRDQNQFNGSVLLVGQGKKPAHAEEFKANGKRIRRSEIAFFEEKEDEPNFQQGSSKEIGRKSRNLLQSEENETFRRKKFISQLKNSSDWANELSQMTVKDLEDQKLKTLILPLYWKNDSRLESEISKKVNETNDGDNLREVEKILPLVLRRIKKREKWTKTDLSTRTKLLAGNENQKSSSEAVDPGKSVPGESFESSPIQNQTRADSLNGTLTGQHAGRNISTTDSYLTGPGSDEPGQNLVDSLQSFEHDNLIKGSDQVVTTIRPTEIAFRYNTYASRPVGEHHNHRLHYDSSGGNQAAEIVLPQSTIRTEIKTERDEHAVEVTRMPPVHYQKAIPPYLVVVPDRGKPKYGKKRPNHKKVFQKERERPLRYKHSPHRRIVSQGQQSHHHIERYPMAVADFPVQQSDFDLVKFALTMLRSLARPFARLVPAFRQENLDEPECFDLLVCEGQRLFKFMGPTAESFATTLGTLLTWSAEEKTRSILVEAIKSGKENTCRRQIEDCEGKSGGKSIMTVVAQFLEANLLK